MTYSQYAESRGLTSQAIYYTIKKNQEQFEGHIEKNDKGFNYLDDEAIAILDRIFNHSIKRNQLAMASADLLQAKAEANIEKQLRENDKKHYQELVIEKDKTRALVMESLTTFSGSMENLSSDTRLLREYNEAMRDDISALTRRIATNDQLQARIESLIAENTRLTSQVADLEEKLRVKSAELEDLKGRRLTLSERISGKSQK